MSSYAYSGYLWPSFLAVVLVATLAWYGWRHREVPGALPLAAACLFAVAWSIGSLLESAAVDPSTKIVWLKFVTVWQLPVVTAATCFVLQYAGLSRWLTRRSLMLLAIPPLLLAGMILSNYQHLMWSRFSFVAGTIHPTLGPAGDAGLTYSFLLSLFNIGILVWLFARSPRHRVPVGLLVLALVGGRILFLFGVLDFALPRQWDPDPLVIVLMFGLYAVALFRFHLFDLTPTARTAALKEMQEGMLVLDLQDRIVDANPAAERTFGEMVAGLRGRKAEEVLPLGACLGEVAGGDSDPDSELELGTGAQARHYRVGVRTLMDKHGSLGRLLLLHDVTEERKAQARVIEQERVVATLQERERLARELHDGVGQVLGYLSMQAQTARKRLHDGDDEKADSLLARLADVAQHAHVDVRESILALKAASSEDWSFLPTLDTYLRDFQDQYGIQTKLSVADDVSEGCFGPYAAVQLLRVIQEALTNARRHGTAGRVCIEVGRDDGQVCINVADDGRGFDPSRVELDASHHFGLVFMRERMAQI
jgi:signal transduction histidine kinase